jgi:hypothetical protein
VEYFLGSLITLVVIAIMNYMFKNEKQNLKTFAVLKYSQSYAHDLLLPFFPTNSDLAKLNAKPTQSSKHDKVNQVRVLISKNRAYWIRNNAFYTADVEQGEVLKETTRAVDTMGMDSVQLEEMTFIVEQLTKGIRNDSSNPGEQSF